VCYSHIKRDAKPASWASHCYLQLWAMLILRSTKCLAATLAEQGFLDAYIDLALVHQVL